MTPSVPNEPQTLPYARGENVAERSVWRACAAAMVAAGVIKLCRFMYDALVLLAQSEWEDLLRPSPRSVSNYLRLATGAVSVFLVIAGIAWWRRDGYRPRVLARWTLFVWLCVAAAGWFNRFLIDVRFHNLPDSAAEAPVYAVDVLGDALPIVLPALLWWIVRRTSAAGGVVR